MVICRSEPTSAGTVTHSENSDVFPIESVAVAVTTCPGARPTGSTTLIGALQKASVATDVDPINVAPWPKPEESHELLEKNSILKVLDAVLSRLPLMTVFMPLDWADVRFGKF
jgi:hypothetical protein